MKINSICVGYNKINFNNSVNNFNKLNSLTTDTFVRNSNNIAFGAKSSFNSKFKQFLPQIEEYIMNSPNIKLADIEAIVKKFSPKTSVDKMENLRTERDTSLCIAYTKHFIGLCIDENDKLVAQEDPKIIYLNLPKELTKESRARLLENIVHEMTHVLQDESYDRYSSVEFLENMIKSSKLTKENAQELGKMNKSFVAVEKMMRFFITNNLNINDYKIKEIPKTQNAKNLCKLCYGLSVDEITAQMIEQVISQIKPQDIKTCLKYIQFKANREMEAHINGYSILKKQMKLENKNTGFDVVIDFYRSLENSAKKLQQKMEH